MANRTSSARLLWVEVLEMEEHSRLGRWGLVVFSRAGGWCISRGTRAEMQELQQQLLVATADEDGDFAAGVEEFARAAAGFLRVRRRRR